MVFLLSGPNAMSAGPETGDIVLGSRIFDIPFQMKGGTEAKAVRLYVSSDRGKSWKIADHQPLPLEKFHFEADEDGEFWFAHATDLHKIVDPAQQLRAERRIIIDTRGPFIQLEGTADLNGKLTATLTMTDEQTVKTLRVLYATDVERTWKAVENDAIDSNGMFSVDPPEDWRQMSVHVTSSDSLDNVSVQAKTFRRPRFASNGGGLPAKSESQIRTAAGPSDPPSFLLGPHTGEMGTAPTMLPPSAAPGASPRAPSAPMTAPAPGPMTGYGSSYTRPPAGYQAQSAPSNTYTPSAASGMPLRGMATPPNARRPMPSPAALPSAQSPSGAASAYPAGMGGSYNAAGGSPAMLTGPSPAQSLPPSGVAARLTTGGIETVAPPVPVPDPRMHSTPATQVPTALGPAALGPAAQPNLLFAPPDQLNAPADPNGPATSNVTTPLNPGDPITEAIPTPAATAAEKPAAKPRPRTLRDAMRPMSAQPTSPNRAPESIPTPAGNDNSAERYRVERAEQATREMQSRYDLASLGNSAVVRYSDSNRFSLDYELEAVASSGVESVELYGSVDGGRQWKRWGADPDRKSPFDIETKGEGLFAFRIVVMGNNGLATPRPLAGDSPDIVVVVDQQLPQIQITSARYGEGDRTGSLVIRYECSDDNLMSRPVAIAFSESIEGPWTTIAAGLRNDGLYVWPADPKLPPKIFLRIDATDQAGNTGRHLLDQPIATMGLAPRAKILGFRSR